MWTKALKMFPEHSSDSSRAQPLGLGHPRVRPAPLAILALLVLLALAGCQSATTPAATTAPAGSESSSAPAPDAQPTLTVQQWLDQGVGERTMPDEGAAHVAPGEAISWRANPPASGTHYPQAAPWVIHQQPVEPGYWVHSLEHSGVVLLYKCPNNTCPDTIKQLEALRAKLPPSKHNNIKLAAVPYNDMTPPFMAVAWNAQLDLETLDENRIQAFYQKYVDKGPEDVP
jgi:hypothetical protein